jgi:hypothetical protein
MRNAQVAQWILSLVTSPDRASSTVGDLMENSASPGRFWFGALRTAVSLLWSDVAANPGRMVRLAGCGFLVGLTLAVVWVLVIIPLAVPLRQGDPNVWKPWAFNVLMLLGAIILVPFLQGRWLARRSPGQELAACLALAILTATVDVIMVASGMETIGQLTLSVASPLIPMFAGAALIRRKRIAS